MMEAAIADVEVVLETGQGYQKTKYDEIMKIIDYLPHTVAGIRLGRQETS